MVCLITPSINCSIENKDNCEDSPKNNKNMDESSEWGYNLKRVAGGSIISYPPVFSSDGEFLYTICKNAVQTYSTTTGELVKILDGALEDLIGLHQDLFNSKLLVGCTRSGEIVKWKPRIGTIDCKVKLTLGQAQVLTFNPMNPHAEVPSALVAYKTNSTDTVNLTVFDLTSGKRLHAVENIEIKDDSLQIDVDNNNFNYFALVRKSKLFIVHYKKWNTKVWRNAKRVPFTCVRCHPTEEMVATGDKLGKIVLWRQIFSQSEPVSVLYHWHHTPVTSISFTKSGTGFYSSGLEAVLVKWNIERPDLKEFLPRMSSPIMHIAVGDENKKVSVSMADNGIQILNSQNKPNCILQNFTYVFESNTGLEKFPIGLKIDPRTNSLVLNGRIGHLQFFSTHTNSLLYNVDIVLQNRLSIEASKILYDTRVTKAAFNTDWMATGEIWDDLENAPELRLKFWQFNKENQKYTLNTNIEQPHENGFRTIEFSQSGECTNLICATAGTDNFIKIWALEDSDSIYKKGKSWYCVALTNYKSLGLSSIAFSVDGSLLAAGFGNSLCVYKSETLKLRTVLSAPSGVDGSIQKVIIDLPKGNINGGNRRKEDKEYRIKTMELFKKFLSNNDQELVKQITSETIKSPKKMPVNITDRKLDSKRQELLFKKIQSIQDLNLFHKLSLYQKLGVGCNVKKDGQNEILRYFEKHKLRDDKELESFLGSISLRDRFKAKYRLYLCRTRKKSCCVNQELASFLKSLNIKSTKKPIENTQNGYLSDKDVEMTPTEKDIKISSVNCMSLQGTATIRHIVFGTTEFAHLVIICTEHRLLVWNLLTLRLQSVLQLSVDQIAVDAVTSLVAVITTYNELYVFLPTKPLPLYHRKNLPKVKGTVWVPRRTPKAQSISLDWQATSILYLLTESQELMCFVSKNDTLETFAAFENDAPEAPTISLVGAYPKHRVNQVNNQINQNLKSNFMGVLGKASTKSFVETAAHTMASVNLLRSDFLRAFLISDSSKDIIKASSSHRKSDSALEKSDSDDDDSQLNQTIKTRKSKLNKLSGNVESASKTNFVIEEKKLRKILCEKVDL